MTRGRPLRTLDVVLTRVRVSANTLVDAAVVAVSGLISVGGTALASTHQPDDHGFGAVGITLLVVAVLALAFRNRYPVAVLAVVVAATMSHWSLGYARGPVFIPLIVALVTVVLHGHRIAAVASLVVGFVGFPWGAYLLGRSDERPTLAALVGLAAWLVTLVSLSEMWRYRRDRAESAALSQAEALRRRTTEERLRIARELHDVVAHNMSLISIQAGVALHLMDQQPEQARTSLTTIKQASKDALVELRSILGVLRQVDEADEGLDGAGVGAGLSGVGPDDAHDAAPRRPAPSLARLDDLLARSRAAGVAVRVELDADLAVPSHVDLAAFRIVQESLTNVARHSDDRSPLVRIRRDDGALTVEVLDEGTAPVGPVTSAAGGYGIAGMRERAAAVGGRLDAGPRPGQGFAVRAALPFDEPDVGAPGTETDPATDDDDEERR